MIIKIEQNMDLSKIDKKFLAKHKADLFDKNEPIMSDYAIGFDKYTFSTLEMTYMCLSCEESYMNDCCKFRGHTFLNEVYDRLNFPRTKAGQVMGWFAENINDPKQLIEFTLYIDDDGYVIDFNVEGNIYDIFDEISK